MRGHDKKLITTSVLVLAIIAVLPATLLLGPFNLGMGDTARLTAILTFVGVLVTASVSLIGLMVSRQTERRLERERLDQHDRLKLDAAMRAGHLLSPTDSATAAPAAMASGLLALTKLDHAELSVALLVDLWSDGNDKISKETAILVIDAALRSDSRSAQLVAAELLCRNAERLNPCQSLDWPSAVEGCWVPDFSPRTKLLIVQALVNMTLGGPHSESALRSVVVRLFGIWRDDPDERVKGCVGKLIHALMPAVSELRYQEFLQGNQRVLLKDLEEAAASRASNPDGYLAHLSDCLASQLAQWAGKCTQAPESAPLLATAEHGPNLQQTDEPRHFLARRFLPRRPRREQHPLAK
ncbi:hypothetical protein [Nonomuraea jabiensis]|uniref:hypothetical protein n=1 Tax=Nonomuraea jabiensis TaxID=882448 RepID=UPI003D753FB8